MSSANKIAQALKAMHRRDKKPVVLANVYDRLSADAVAEIPQAEALGTASYAIARAAGVADDDLSLEANLAAVQGIAAVAREHEKPLTVDIQDGYGGRLEEAVGKLLDLGVAGINLEDADKYNSKMYATEVAVERIRRALAVAKRRGVPDFVVNARCDALVRRGEFGEVLERGKKYLEAGATSVFVWGGDRGVSKAEVEKMVETFDGKLNVMLKMTPDGLKIGELAEMGVARISVGPSLQFMAMAAYKKGAKEILQQS